MRDKNAKEEWHGWPHFDVKAKELEGFFCAGESAFDKGDYPAARILFSKVRDNWYWLSSNKTARAGALAARARADVARKSADSVRAVELACEAYSGSTNAFAQALQAFECGAFAAAAEGFDETKHEFEKSMVLAKAETERLAAKRKKADTEAALSFFRANPPRYEEGFRLAQTADHDNSDIQFYLGVCHDFGYGGAPKDDSIAMQWYRKAAEQGSVNAQREMGWRHQKGLGVDKDLSKAVEWYRKAAEQGYSTAQYDMGVMYQNGWGVSKDEAEAVKWYRKAAKSGYVNAQKTLSRRNIQW